MKSRNVTSFLQAIANRRCVLYGAGPAARELMSETSFPADYVVDDNSDLWGEKLAGVEIRNPATLGQEPVDDRPIVVIGSTIVERISDRLADLGYERGIDSILSPLIMERAHEAEGERHPILLVTSPSDDGGLFKIDLNNRSVERLVAGNCRGLEVTRDGYWLALEFSGVLNLNRSFQETGRIEYPDNLNLNSVAHDPDRNALYVVETRMDRIAVYDAASHDLRRHIPVGPDLTPAQAQYHVNDIALREGALLASVFSAEGVQRDGVTQDGAVLRIDPETGARTGKVLGGLEQPHSILLDDDGLWICSSMARTLQHGDRTATHLLGYIRGLARWNEYFYIGQSQMRRLSRFRDRFDNVSLDCAINIWDSETKTLRTVQMPFDNIYDIRILPTEA